MFKPAAHCIHPITIVDNANEKVKPEFNNAQCEPSDSEQAGLFVNPG